MMIKKQVNALIMGLLFLSVIFTAWADDDDHKEHHERNKRDKYLTQYQDVAAVNDKIYLEECGVCHFAYQPGWLPELSWRKLLDEKQLADHFGEHADLDEETRTHIMQVLAEQSADKSEFKRSRKVMKSLKPGEAPLRLTEIAYIRRKHHELRDEHLVKNDQVRSLSYCDKCHPNAKDGVFLEYEVFIPGLRWHR